ncbi:MAG: hypothetical protein JWN29_2714 [Acidimicrobiales bacterium]|nr:hypothetical protein [Acidimicrobiales bacterium]
MSRVAVVGLVVGVSGAIGLAAFAFTASNTVPATTVGAGSGTVSGYTVSSVHYTLNTTTPVNIDSLSFTVAPVIPSTGTGKVVVSATLSVGGPTSYNCTSNTTGDTVTCATTSPQLTADKLNGLTVVAAQ